MLSVFSRGVGTFLPDAVADSPAVFSALTDVPLFIGYISSFLLQGILMVQVFIYYLSFPKDSRYMKGLVFATFFVECLSSVFATIAGIQSLIQFGDLFDLSYLWAFRALAPLCGLATLIVHMFYSWRIWVIGNSWILPAVILVLSVSQCTMVVTSGFTSILGAGTETEQRPQLLTINIVWLAGSAMCDIIIATTLVVLLRRARNRVETEKAKTTLEKITALTVETGMITAFGAVIELLFFLAFRNSFIHFIMFYMLPKLYANCMLATLNARLAIPGRTFREMSTAQATLGLDHEIAFGPNTSAGSQADLRILVQQAGLDRRSMDEITMKMEKYIRQEEENDTLYEEHYVRRLPTIPEAF